MGANVKNLQFTALVTKRFVWIKEQPLFIEVVSEKKRVAKYRYLTDKPIIEYRRKNEYP